MTRAVSMGRHRIQLLRALIDCGPGTVAQIADTFGRSEPTVGDRLRRMQRAGLAEPRGHGARVGRVGLQPVLWRVTDAGRDALARSET
jgi:DNA-binding Lrp family transcriptional regulator